MRISKEQKKPDKTVKDIAIFSQADLSLSRCLAAALDYYCLNRI